MELRNTRRIRKLSVHLTRLTVEDIDEIRRQVQGQAEEKAKSNSKASTKKKTSSNRQSSLPPASSGISEKKVKSDSPAPAKKKKFSNRQSSAPTVSSADSEAKVKSESTVPTKKKRSSHCQSSVPAASSVKSEEKVTDSTAPTKKKKPLNCQSSVPSVPSVKSEEKVTDSTVPTKKKKSSNCQSSVPSVPSVKSEEKVTDSTVPTKKKKSSNRHSSVPSASSVKSEEKLKSASTAPTKNENSSTCQSSVPTASSAHSVEEVKTDSTVPKMKTESSNRQSSVATASSVNCILESTDDASLRKRPRNPPTTKCKKKRPSFSTKGSKRKKSSPSKSSSKQIILNACSSTWDDHRSYSTSEESELEEVFVPQKIWVKPSARPMTPTMSKSDVSQENSPKIKYNIPSTFPIRRPIVLLKKMIPEPDTKYEVCDDAMPSTSELQTSNSSNTNCCLLWQEAFQGSTLETVPILGASHGGESEPTESADEKLPLQMDESCEDTDKPDPTDDVKLSDITISQITANAKIPARSPSPCSCRLPVASSKPITSAVQTDQPEASTQSALLTNESADTSTPDSVRDAGVAERNQTDDAVLSPVIFGEESEATQEFSCQVSSPIIFGSDEGAAAEGVDDGSNSHCQDAISDLGNASSSFSLELSVNEQSLRALDKNCDPTTDASQNFNLQLSENISHPNVESRVSSQESVSSNSALETPGECAAADVSASKNSQLSSSNGNLQLSLGTNECSSSETEAPCSLTRLETASIPESEKVNSPGLKDTSHLDSNRIWSSAVQPNLFQNQNILVYSVKRLDPERPKIFLKKSWDSGEKSCLSVAEDSSQKNPLSRVEASYLLKNMREPKVWMSKTKKSYSSNIKPSFSRSKKSCPTVSDAANLCQKSYSSPLERLKPLGTKSNVSFTKSTKQPAPVPSHCNDAFTQTDLAQVPQQPSQLSVNYIINSSSLDTIRFEGPVVNPSTITAISDKIAPSDSTYVADSLRCHMFSSSHTKRKSSKCAERNFSFTLPDSDSHVESSNVHAHASTACCSDSTLDFRKTSSSSSQFVASETVIDSIDLTCDDEPKCEEVHLGKIRLKTPSQLGCTIDFADDVERLFRHELPKLQCDFDKLELLKKRHFNIFKFVLARYSHGIPVIDTLQELYNTRSVPGGSNLLRNPPLAGLPSKQMFVQSPSVPGSIDPRNSSGIGNRNSMLVRGHHRDATVLGKPIC